MDLPENIRRWADLSGGDQFPKPHTTAVWFELRGGRAQTCAAGSSFCNEVRHIGAFIGAFMGAFRTAFITFITWETDMRRVFSAAADAFSPVQVFNSWQVVQDQALQ